MPTNRFPVQADVAKFYGDPTANLAKWKAEYLVDVKCPWTLYMDKTPLHFIQVNKKCAQSLSIVLNKIWNAVHEDQGAIETLHYHRYSGSFNYRPMRGGHALSMHSYGIAIDFDADENEFGSHQALFKPDSLIVKTFEEEGWVWGGHWSKPDNMHFQAARVHALPDELRSWSVPHSEWLVTANTVTVSVSNTEPLIVSNTVPGQIFINTNSIPVEIKKQPTIWQRIKEWI